MITQDLLKEMFYYNGSDLVWNVNKQKVKRGEVAGNVDSNGYRNIMINYKYYRAHRLVWLYHYGEWPKHQIDHINGNREDNRIENLRDVSHKENCKNQKNLKTINQVL